MSAVLKTCLASLLPAFLTAVLGHQHLLGVFSVSREVRERLIHLFGLMPMWCDWM